MPWGSSECPNLCSVYQVLTRCTGVQCGLVVSVVHAWVRCDVGWFLFSSFLAVCCGKSSGICGAVLIEQRVWKHQERENSSCQMQESAECCTFLKNC